MDRKCYVPYCDESCAESGEADRLIFKAPLVSTTSQTWKDILPLAEYEFDPQQDGICIKHFEDQYILKEEFAFIGGKPVITKLDPWVLSADAIPTIFDEESDDEDEDSQVPIIKSVTTIDKLPDVENDDSQDHEDDAAMDVDDDTPEKHAEENGAVKTGPTSRKSTAKPPGPVSKKSTAKPPGAISDEKRNSTSGRSPHLKREIVPPSKYKEEDEDYVEYEDDPDPPSSPEFNPKRKSKRGRPKKGSPTKAQLAKERKAAAAAAQRVEPLKIKLPTAGSKKQGTVAGPSTKYSSQCFVEKCNRNPFATLFKMPQMTKTKLRDWIRYIPPAVQDGVSFDPKLHLLCEEHFDKKFIMNTPNGKILTGDAIPSIFPNYPRINQKGQSGKRGQPQPDPMEAKKARMNPAARKGGKQKDGKGRVEVVDGFEIEYDNDDDYEPILVTIDDDEDEDSKNPVKPVAAKKPATTTPAKPKQPRILEMGDPRYSLQYIYDMKEKIQLPQAEVWIFQMMSDKETRTKCIYIAEIVPRNDRLLIRRSIKINEDLTFRVEANDLEFTQMFNESGNKIDSLYKLQEMILDLSAFKVCEGWTQFASIEASNVGRKIQGIWFAKNCEGLNLNNSRCRPCLTLKSSLAARKAGVTAVTDSNSVNQIRKLPKDDPLHLQLQIQDLVKERTKLKYDLSNAEKREQRLHERVRVLEGANKPKPPVPVTSKTVFVPQPSQPKPVVATPGKPSVAVAPSSNIRYAPAGTIGPRSRMQGPAGPRVTVAPVNPPLVRGSIPPRPPASTTPGPVQQQQQLQMQPRMVTAPSTMPMPAPQPQPPPQQVQVQMSNTNNMMGQQQPQLHYTIGHGPGGYQAVLTPTFVLAQGSGIIGHQPVMESRQVLPPASLASSTLSPVNVTVQKSTTSPGNDSEHVTLMSL